MFFSDLYNISMEKTSDCKDQNSSFRLFILFDFLLSQKVTNWVSKAYSGVSFPKIKETPKPLSHSKNEEEDEEKMSREEVKMVMGNLGLFCSEETEESLPVGSVKELSKLFDEKEATMEEVKEAFEVLDVNRDGFIDAEELQRILWVLGLREGEDIENCKKMIEFFDGNNDGRIDLEEFVKLMESAA